MVTMEQNATSSQILIFETLRQFTQFVDNTIQLHKSMLARYEEDLGLTLRQAEQNAGEAEWAKEMQSKLVPQSKQVQKDDEKKEEKHDKGKEEKEAERKEEKAERKEEKAKRKEEKAKKGSTNWKMYNDVQIYTGNATQGKTEVYFEAVNELKTQVDRLNRVRETIAQLTNAGISNAFYLVYTKNNMPEKLVLLPQGKQDKEKFEFKADFVTENAEMPTQ